MCGIAGWIGHQAEASDLPARLIAALSHRGPDGEAWKRFDDGCLVHTRLRVLDLSECGTQPMSTPDGQAWVVFNGEIYNHRALRTELEADGHRFRGHSDTEVIAPLYRKLGARFVERLRGMFAIAVFDLPRRRVLLTRDRFGIKPLFFASTGSGVAFGSEIGALLEFPTVDRSVDAQAVRDFVALHFIPPPGTFYRGITAVEPGQMVEVTLNGGRAVTSPRRYHTWSVAPDKSLDLASAADRAGELLDRAVSSQLEADVPLGSMLSGGIDSSLVSHAAQRSVGGSLRTFSVRFSDAAFDESAVAANAAGTLGTDHVVLDFSCREPSWDFVTGLVKDAGQPFADTSVLAVHALSRLVREHVTVSLSGDGGDEGFGGYDLYGRLRALAAVQQIPAVARSPLLRLTASAARGAASGGLVPLRASSRLRDLATTARPSQVLADSKSWVREAELARLWRGARCEPVWRLFEPVWRHDLPGRASALERLSALTTEVDTRLRLAGDYLPKVDLASMRASLEVRVPMLDEELFAFGLSLPHRLKASRSQRKLVLRELTRRRVPAVAEHPKHGFGVPFDTWVDDAFRARYREEILDGGSRLDEFLDPAAYRPLVDAFCTRATPPGLTRQGLYQRAFMLLALKVHLDRGR